MGLQVHSEGVARLRESYAALPPGAPVRLAKRTSNLFRGRSELGAGLVVVVAGQEVDVHFVGFCED